MFRTELRRLVQRFVILFFLLGCLAVLSSPLHVRVLAELCQTCDENRYNCYVACSNTYESCLDAGNPWITCEVQYQECGDGCDNTYSSCLNFCDFREGGGGGGGGGGCGRQRTPCERACHDARAECVQNGGTTCGQEYTDCMNACCP